MNRNKISYEEAEDILQELRDNDYFQHDIFGYQIILLSLC